MITRLNSRQRQSSLALAVPHLSSGRKSVTQLWSLYDIRIFMPHLKFIEKYRGRFSSIEDLWELAKPALING
jgi:hypothetical protein